MKFIETIYSIIIPKEAPYEDFNLLLLADNKLVGLKKYWPLPEASDYVKDIEKIIPNWKAFMILEGKIIIDELERRFIGTPLCGSVKGN